jgi:hypothetical protein
MDDAKLGRSLNEVRLCLQHRGKGLVEIGRYFGEIPGLLGLRRQPQRDADLVRIGKGLGHLSASDRHCGLPPVVLLLGGRRRRDQLLCSLEFKLGELERRPAHFDAGHPGAQQRYLIFHCLHGVLQVPAPAPGLGFDAPHRGVGRFEIGLCRIDGRLLHCNGVYERLLVELNKQIAFAHAVVVIDQNARNLTVDARRNERRMAVHEGIVRRHRAESEAYPGNTEPKCDRDGQSADRPQHQALPPKDVASMDLICGIDARSGRPESIPSCGRGHGFQGRTQLQGCACGRRDVRGYGLTYRTSVD